MPRALIHGFGTLRKHGKQKKNTNLRKHFFSWGGGGRRVDVGDDYTTDRGDGPFDPP